MRERRPILCVGALTCDVIFHVPEIPTTSGKFLATGAAFVCAGMATSAATAVARLGRPVALWASIGDDAPAAFLAGEVEREGIATDFLRRVPGAASASAAIVVDAQGERLVIPYYDPALTAAAGPLPPIGAGRFAAVMTDVRWPAAAAAALDAARAAGIPAILDLDVGPAEVLADLAPRASHLVASEAGARLLTGAASAEASVIALAATPRAATVVTAGERGSWWFDRTSGTAAHVPAFTVAAVDTNAAGDVFHGAYAVGLVEGLAPVPLLRFAAAAAAIKCTRPGGRLGAPRRSEVDLFLETAAR